jgi:hypothetical protein
MRNAYEVLLNVSFNHTYFLSKRFAGMDITPSSSTELLFLNNGLVFKTNYDGFTIAFDTNFYGLKRNREDLVSNLLNCRFIVTLKDTGFYNYTAIGGTDISKKVFHFYNAKEDSEGLNKTLHAEEFVSENDLKAIADFDETYFVKPFAILDLRLAPELPESYSLNFKARETIWRYILMGEHLQSLNNPAIIDSNGTVPFEGPELLKFSGTKGLAFRSKQTISLSESSNQNFQLVENFDAETGRYKVVMRSLPKANPELITLIKGDITIENNNYSEIFIN